MAKARSGEAGRRAIPGGFCARTKRRRCDGRRSADRCDIRTHAEAVGRAHSAIFSGVLPAATMVGTPELIHPDLLVEVEIVAWRAEEDPAA